MTAVSVEQGPRHLPIAPYRHTFILMAIFLLLAAAGFLFQSKGTLGPASHANAVQLYVAMIALEWGLLLYVRAGMRKSGTTLRHLIRPRLSGRGIGADILLATGMWLVWTGFEFGYAHFIGDATHVSIKPLLAQTPIEVVLWIVLSVSAGICEEAAFRGYFQRQFGALTGSTILGIVLQALLFGVAHGYEGVDATIKIVAFGLLFGAVAAWRKSLGPGIMAHAVTDIVAGLLHV